MREFKVVLLWDLGLLTLSTRGDCPLCQTPKADTVCAQRANQGKAEAWVPGSQCGILMRGSHFIMGFRLHQPKWPGRKANWDPAILFRAELASTVHPKPGGYSPEEPSLWFLPSMPLWWHLLQALVIMILNLLSTRVTPRVFRFFFLPVCCWCSDLPWEYFKTNC